MKKWNLMLLAGLMALAMTACGADAEEVAPTVETTKETVATESATTEEPVVEETVEEEPKAVWEPGQLIFGDVTVALNEALTPDQLVALGEPVDMMEAPSCHFDGMDTLYFYEDFSLYTYMDGENSVVYLMELVTEKYTTPEGLAVGMTRDEVTAIMGTDFDDTGAMLTYTQGDVATAFSLDENGLVWLIEVLEA